MTNEEWYGMAVLYRDALRVLETCDGEIRTLEAQIKAHNESRQTAKQTIADLGKKMQEFLSKMDPEVKPGGGKK